MTDTDRDPTSPPTDPATSISDLPAPRERAPEGAGSRGSTGAADRVPPDAIEEAVRTGGSAISAEGPPPQEGDPDLLPRDDVPPVGSIVPDDLPSEDVNVPDPDGPADDPDDGSGRDVDPERSPGLSA